MADRQIKKEIRDTYDIISDHFSSTRGYLWKECTDFIDNSPKSSKFLDIGCGNGRNIFYAIKQNHNITGCDISSRLLSIIHTQQENIPLFQCDAVSLPLKTNSFDRILFIATIHHLPSEKERIKSLKEIKRILKAEGKALISAWAIDQPKFKDIKTKDGDITLKWNNTYDRFFHLFKKGELEILCKKANLSIISAFSEKNNYYIEVSNKY